MNSNNGNNLTVLVTGTTSGIGYSLCTLFARKGFGLILVSRDQEKLEQQKKEYEKYNQNILIYPKDLNAENAVQEIYDFVQSQNKEVDILINNAGFNEYGEFIDTRIENELKMIQLHNMVLTQMTKLFSKKMVARGKGYIMNLGSTGSYAPFPLDAVYAASKAYVLNFSRGIGSELRKKGIFVSTLCPGATKTMFAQKAEMEQTFLFKYFVMLPDEVARIAIKGLFKKKRVIVPGLYNKLLIGTMKITPYFILEKISPLYFKNVK